MQKTGWEFLEGSGYNVDCWEGYIYIYTYQHAILFLQKWYISKTASVAFFICHF